MKTIALSDARERLDELFQDAQQGSPVLLVRGEEMVRMQRVEPPEFGGDLGTMENMLLEAVRGPHSDWTPRDLEDIARRVRERRRQ